MNKNIKLKYKLRTIAILLIFILLNLGLNIKSIPSGEIDLYLYKNNEDYSGDKYLYVTAKNGDTIWNLVKSNYESIEKPVNMDFRDVVIATMELNDGANLDIGQHVLLPKTLK